MQPNWRETDLTGNLVFNRCLGRGGDLDVVQDLLAVTAPKWCRRLRVWKGPRDQVPADISDRGALAGTVLGAAGERGETYHALVEAFGRLGNDVALQVRKPRVEGEPAATWLRETMRVLVRAALARVGRGLP